DHKHRGAIDACRCGDGALACAWLEDGHPGRAPGELRHVVSQVVGGGEEVPTLRVGDLARLEHGADESARVAAQGEDVGTLLGAAGDLERSLPAPPSGDEHLV